MCVTEVVARLYGDLPAVGERRVGQSREPQTFAAIAAVWKTSARTPAAAVFSSVFDASYRARASGNSAPSRTPSSVYRPAQ
ncbi:hypothetical protein OG413_08435 [Streptomyces sp. NBC_01433]|uniref:hypothetical protein n=1 Tax=Streptomyces sp. NBC_01433 TaxID=2903864 RepID=UPI002255FE11|nr:hypothetical protein [Streptomyces sp. NBC_01433]MCX4675350.1 hypothetical protein [Streptomyces sp. NBC_01433]